MAKYYSDKSGRYVSLDDFTKDMCISRLSLNSYGNPCILDNLLDLVKSIITSKNAKHYYDGDIEYGEVILGSLHISIGHLEININESVDTGLYSPSDLDLTMKFFNEFLNYFNNG